MKKAKYTSITITLLMIALLLTGCNQTTLSSNETEESGKQYMEISYSKASFTKEELLEMSDIIIKGKVLKVQNQFMTNPNKTRTDENGDVIDNEQITEYIVEIEQLFKGDYQESTICVKTANGRGLSPDLILYGEDENYILSSEIDRLDLEIGKNCLLFLRSIKDGCQERHGYYPTMGAPGYFLQDEKGDFSNQKAANIIFLSPDTLAQDIALSKK